MRISVIGLQGSGKTFLAEAISKKLSIPHIHLDRFWFEAGGLQVGHKGPEVERERIRAYIRERALVAIAAPDWVSDGLYSKAIQTDIAERADHIIFLDISLWRRLLNHAKRITKRSVRHPELNMWHELLFFSEIFHRTFISGPKLKKLATQYKEKVIILKSKKEIDEYIRTIA